MRAGIVNELSTQSAVESLREIAAREAERVRVRRRAIEQAEKIAIKADATASVNADFSAFWAARIAKALESGEPLATNQGIREARSDQAYVTALQDLLGPVFMVFKGRYGLFNRREYIGIRWP